MFRPLLIMTRPEPPLVVVVDEVPRAAFSAVDDWSEQPFSGSIVEPPFESNVVEPSVAKLGSIVSIVEPSVETEVMLGVNEDVAAWEPSVAKLGSMEPSWSCRASGRGRGRRGGQAALQVGHYAARI